MEPGAKLLCSKLVCTSETIGAAQGGSEARHSNELLHRIIAEAVEAVAPEVGPGLVGLVSTRDEITNLLKLDDVIDLVRGTCRVCNDSLPNQDLPQHP